MAKEKVNYQEVYDLSVMLRNQGTYASSVWIME